MRILSLPALGRSLLSLVALFALPPALYSETEDRIDRTFEVTPNTRLVVEVDSGSIEVRGGKGSAVVVEVTRTVRAKSKSRENEILSNHVFGFVQDAGGVRVTSKTERGAESRGWPFRKESYRAHVIVQVPSTMSVDLTTSGGGIVVSDVRGGTRARTSGGGLKFENLASGVDGRTSGGGIELRECSGPIRVATSGGSIQAEGCEGKLELSTSGGGIDVEGLKGQLNASTSGGSIQAVLLSPIEQECRLSTSGGSIRVLVPADAAFDLDARTSGGGVKSDLPVAVVGEHHRSSLRGDVNGGGGLLKLRTSGGSIRIARTT